MARIRTIKPEFFLDEDVSDLHPLTRLLFIGLWCLSDKAGRLEDRPQRIKVQIIPYDDFNIDDALDDLHSKNFIIRYAVDDKKLIQIRSFEKHQRITGKEAQTISLYPEPTCEAPEKHPRNNRETPEKHPGAQERKGKERNIKELSLNPNPPVDNSAPPTTEPALSEHHEQEEPDISFHDFDPPRNPDRKPLLNGLRELVDRLSIHYNATNQRQIMMFIEANIHNKNPDAIKHCLESLVHAVCDIGDKVERPRAYMEAALKIEDGKYNAKGEELRCNEYKRPTHQGMESLGAIMSRAGK